jgi:hypothetical protein
MFEAGARASWVTVRIAFARSLARYVRQHQWHPSQRLRDLPDGRLELTVRVGDTAEMRRWVLGYGAQAEVLAPLSMREALRREAERLAAVLVPARRGRRRSRERSARDGWRGAITMKVRFSNRPAGSARFVRYSVNTTALSERRRATCDRRWPWRRATP